MSEESPLELDLTSQAIDPTAFVADNATLIGRVRLGRQSTILFGAVVRGDSAPITIGERTNIQDLVCLHADPGFPCILGNGVTVGHAAVVHGAEIDDDVLIGIRAVVLNGAKIGKHTIVGAGAVVPEGKEIPPGTLVLGVPGRVVRELTDKDLQYIHQAAAHYVAAGERYRQHLRQKG